jgi:hypothetical protein
MIYNDKFKQNHEKWLGKKINFTTKFVPRKKYYVMTIYALNISLGQNRWWT